MNTDGCQCSACLAEGLHASDCAVHNAPALPVGPCDCHPAAQTDEAHIAEIAGRLAKATKGDWTAHGKMTGVHVVGKSYEVAWVSYARDAATDVYQSDADAAFIAAAPADIAWLVKVVKRQQAWIRQAEERMQYMSDSLRSDVL